MMFDLSHQIQVYHGFVDMRKSINGLCILVSLAQHSFEDGTTFVFFNKNRDKVKLLLRENNGFVLVYKRLDAGKFKISFESKNAVLLTQKQLRYLLNGLDDAHLTRSKNPPPQHYF